MGKQTEAHDWLGEAAECLVRYYFSKRFKGCDVFGSSKWGPDSIIIERKTGKICAEIEVRSTDTNKNKWPRCGKYLRRKFAYRGKKIPKYFVAVKLVRQKLKKEDPEDMIRLGEIWAKIKHPRKNERFLKNSSKL